MPTDSVRGSFRSHGYLCGPPTPEHGYFYGVVLRGGCLVRRPPGRDPGAGTEAELGQDVSRRGRGPCAASVRTRRRSAGCSCLGPPVRPLPDPAGSAGSGQGRGGRLGSGAQGVGDGLGPRWRPPSARAFSYAAGPRTRTISSSHWPCCSDISPVHRRNIGGAGPAVGGLAHAGGPAYRRRAGTRRCRTLERSAPPPLPGCLRPGHPRGPAACPVPAVGLPRDLSHSLHPRSMVR